MRVHKRNDKVPINIMVYLINFNITKLFCHFSLPSELKSRLRYVSKEKRSIKKAICQSAYCESQKLSIRIERKNLYLKANNFYSKSTLLTKP